MEELVWIRFVGSRSAGVAGECRDVRLGKEGYCCERLGGEVKSSGEVWQERSAETLM